MWSVVIYCLQYRKNHGLNLKWLLCFWFGFLIVFRFMNKNRVSWSLKTSKSVSKIFKSGCRESTEYPPLLLQISQSFHPVTDSKFYSDFKSNFTGRELCSAPYFLLNTPKHTGITRCPMLLQSKQRYSVISNNRFTRSLVGGHKFISWSFVPTGGGGCWGYKLQNSDQYSCKLIALSLSSAHELSRI